jgi:hypothetical protein
MYNLYDINFQSNNKFCKIHIHYNNIDDLCTMKDLMKSFMLDKSLIYITKNYIVLKKLLYAYSIIFHYAVSYSKIIE